MKNIKEVQLKKCIFMSLEEFKEILCNLYNNEYYCDACPVDGIDFYTEELSMYEVIMDLEKYFEVSKITSVHIDDGEIIGVWICYKEAK